MAKNGQRQAGSRGRILIPVILVLAVVCAAGVVFVYRGRQKKQEEEEGALTAMYLPVDEERWLFADVKDGALFTAPIPEGELYDGDGQKITQADLARGDLLKIYGDGIMLESYPGQYPGVTRMEVCGKGTEAEADAYEEQLKPLRAESSSNEPPSLFVQYRNSLAAASVTATCGAYDWSYVDENGETARMTAGSVPFLEWEDLIDLEPRDAERLELVFDETPSSVTVRRWPAEDWESHVHGDPIPDGEEIAAVREEDSWILEPAEAGFVYQVTGEWEGRGTAEYGFVTR